MGHIVPSIEITNSLIRHMKNGYSVASALETVLKNGENHFCNQMRCWWAAYQNGKTMEGVFSTGYQKSLEQILQEGLAGSPIIESLEELEFEMNEEFERQWRLYLERLPSLLSLPLLFLFFPSYIILLFGPLLNQFLSEVNL